MYLRLPNQYPYPLDQLRRDYPNTSFPAQLGAALLAEYDVYPVALTAQPAFDAATQCINELAPVQVDGVWTQQWTVRDLTAKELQARVPRSVLKLQGMLAIAEVGLSEAFLTWKAGLDPVADFAALAFLESAQEWHYDDPLLNAALVTLGVAEQKDALFTLAATL